MVPGEEPRRTQCAAVITAERLALSTAVAVHQASAPFAWETPAEVAAALADFTAGLGGR